MKRKWSQDDMASRIAKVLRFEHFYSRWLRDAIRAALITEANVVQLGIFHELLRGPCTPTWLSWRLDMDPAYISRTLGLLELERHITTCPSRDDRRRREVQLTHSGRRI